jgi:hypothetical protein
VAIGYTPPGGGGGGEGPVDSVNGRTGNVVGLAENAALQAEIARATAAEAEKVDLTDVRLTDERTPLDDSVTDAKIVPAGLSQSVVQGLAAALATIPDLAGAETVNGEWNFAGGLNAGGIAVATQADVTAAAPGWTYTALISADYTANINEWVRVNGAATRTISLPADAPHGAKVAVQAWGLAATKTTNITSGTGRFHHSGSGQTLLSLVTDKQTAILTRDANNNVWTVDMTFDVTALDSRFAALDTTTLNAANDYTDTALDSIAEQLTGSSGGTAKVLGNDGVTKFFLRQDDDGAFVFDPLKYQRPDVTGYDVITFPSSTTYSVNGGSAEGFTGSLDFTGSQDVVLYFPPGFALGRAGGLTINNGRNVVIIGGEFDITTTIFPGEQEPGDPPTTDFKTLKLNNQYGDIWLEGLNLHGDRIGDAFQLNHTNGTPCVITMQHVLIGHLTGGGGPSANSIAHSLGGTETTTGYVYSSDVELHSDAFQVLQADAGDLDLMQLRIYRSLWRTAYQGFITNDKLGLGIEAEDWVIDQQTTTYWNGEVATGYAVGLFGSSMTSMPLNFGEGCLVYQSATDNKSVAVYPETHPAAHNLPVTKDAYEDPAWLRSDYGLTYAANKPEPIALGGGDTTVDFGTTAGTARPNTTAAVRWLGTPGTSVRPTNMNPGLGDRWVDR